MTLSPDTPPTRLRLPRLPTVTLRLRRVREALWTIMVCISAGLTDFAVALCAGVGGGLRVGVEVHRVARVALVVGCVLGVFPGGR